MSSGVRIKGLMGSNPATVLSAENGLSKPNVSTVVLGNDVGDVLEPAILTSNRELPMDGRSFRFGSLAGSNGNLIVGNLADNGQRFQVSTTGSFGTSVSSPIVSGSITTLGNLRLRPNTSNFVGNIEFGTTAATIMTFASGDNRLGLNNTMPGLTIDSQINNTTNGGYRFIQNGAGSANLILQCQAQIWTMRQYGTLVSAGYVAQLGVAESRLFQSSSAFFHVRPVSGVPSSANTLAGYFLSTDNTFSALNAAFFDLRETGELILQSAGITTRGTNQTSALLQLNSTTQGLRVPRLTTVQKNAIVSPVSGLIVYDTTLNKLCVYTTAWETITSV